MQKAEQSSSPRDVVQPDWIVLWKIYKHGEEGVHLAGLVNELQGQVSRVTVLKSLARLERKEMISAEWEREVGWKRKYKVKDNKVKSLVEEGLEPLLKQVRRLELEL